MTNTFLLRTARLLIVVQLFVTPGARAADNRGASMMPAATVTTRPNSRLDAAVEAALSSSPHYQNLLNALDTLDADIARSRLGGDHPRMLRMRAQRELYRQKLDAAKTEIATSVVIEANGPEFAGEALGLVVNRPPAAVVARLRLPRGVGLLVDRVAPNSAAAAAGVLAGDVLSRLDGQMLVNSEQFEVVAATLQPGRDVLVEFVRDGAELKRTMKVGANRR